jgi:hypothetical protein
MRSCKKAWVLSTFALAACSGGDLRSRPLDASGFDLRIERGTIEIVPAVMKEAVVGERRLDLTDLIKIGDVFKAIDSQLSASSMQSRSVATSLSVGVSIGAAAPSGGSDGDAGAGSGGGGSAGDDGGSEAPAPQSGASPPSTPALTVPYHEALLSAVETVLGGQALEDLYDIDAVPQGYGLYVVPIVASFTPGTVTRTDYSAEATLTLCAGGDVPEEFRIIAAAPAGFSRIVSDAASDLNQLTLGAALAGQVGALAVSGAFSRIVTELRELSQVQAVPQFQVATPDSRTVGRAVFRQSGRPGLARPAHACHLQ